MVPNQLCIIGAGGFGKEVLCLYLDILGTESDLFRKRVIFAEEDFCWQDRGVHGVPVIPLSLVDFDRYDVCIAISDPDIRSRIAQSLPEDARIATLIHPTATVSRFVRLGEGAIITAGCVLTADVRLGRFAHLNLHTTIGHDTQAGDFLTTSQGVRLSGRNRLGDRVYLGTNAALRQGVCVSDDVIVGMGSMVVKNIPEPGTYAGSPARLLELR